MEAADGEMEVVSVQPNPPSWIRAIRQGWITNFVSVQRMSKFLGIKRAN